MFKKKTLVKFFDKISVARKKLYEKTFNYKNGLRITFVKTSFKLFLRTLFFACLLRKNNLIINH